MPLTDLSEKPFQEELRGALLDAFPSRAVLAQMLYYHLNVKLNEISSESQNLTGTVYEVILSAEKQGRWRELVEAALKANPGNPELVALVAKLPPPSALVRARRKVHYVPLVTLGLLVAAAIGLALVATMMFARVLNATELLTLKIGVGLTMGALIMVAARVLHLPLQPIYVLSGAAIIAAASAGSSIDGSITVSGHVFREGTSEPVAGVVVVIPRSNQNSETNSTGYFVMTGVPAETTTLQMEWGGGLTVRVPIVTAEGGTYSVIPAIRRPVTTASVPIPTASWTRVQAAECVQPNVAFALEVSVPGDPSGRTQLQIDLLTELATRDAKE